MRRQVRYSAKIHWIEIPEEPRPTARNREFHRGRRLQQLQCFLMLTFVQRKQTVQNRAVDPRDIHVNRKALFHVTVESLGTCEISIHCMCQSSTPFDLAAV